jgi:hypothetical protein
MSNETAFVLKLIVTVIVAAALSFTLRAGPVNALAQAGGAPTDRFAGGERALGGRAVVSPRAAATFPARDPEADLAARQIASLQRAIDAAKASLAGDISPELEQIAERSIAAQQKSVEELRAWLAHH